MNTRVNLKSYSRTTYDISKNKPLVYPYLRATTSNTLGNFMDFAEELLKFDHNFSMTKITVCCVTTKILEFV